MIKDISGLKFNKLTALSFIKRENGYTYWEYQCDCGNKVIKKSADVRNKKTGSCGCLNLEHLQKLADKQRHPDKSAARNRLYRNYKRAAKSRNYSFNLTQNYFDNLIFQNCYYCNSIPSNLLKEGKINELYYNGIDRLDNSIGYNLENCVPCCATCNRLKMNLNSDEFLNHVKKINDFLKL